MHENVTIASQIVSSDRDKEINIDHKKRFCQWTIEESMVEVKHVA